MTASGSGTLKYQWYRVAYSSTELSAPTAGVSVSGATSSTYTAPSSYTAQSNDGDNYYVLVTNNYGSAVSSRVVLAVGPGIVLQITANPHTGYIAANTLASFTVGATCTGCIPEYQGYWYTPGSKTVAALANGVVSSGALSGATIAGTTTSSLTLQNVPTTASGATFYVPYLAGARYVLPQPWLQDPQPCRRRNRRRKHSHDGVRRPHGRRARCADHYSHRGTRRLG